MSCNGCRVLRKGCSDACILRHCLRCIESQEAQGHATLFVTKFFGRAGLTGFINGVSENQRPALFQSLLYEACGRTVNPVYGAVGLLFTGNWALCQAAVETVLRGGSPKPAAATLLQKAASTKPTEPNSKSTIDHPEGSITATDHHPESISNMNSSAFSKTYMQPQSLPADQSSFATSACSFKTNSIQANHCVLDFSSYTSGSSSVEEMMTRPHFSKRFRDCKPETAIDKEMMIKRPRSSFLYDRAAAAADHHDGGKDAARRPSITTWVAGYSKANYTRIDSNDRKAYGNAIDEEDNQSAGRMGHDHVSRGGEIRQAPHGLTIQGPLVAPVARRVYIPPQMKQLVQGREDQHEEKVLNINMKRLCNEDDEQAHIVGKGEDYVSALSSVDRHREDTTTKLDLSLQAQPSLCYQDGLNEASLQDRELKQEPHVFVRMSSPSVNSSEGSVDTLVGGLDISAASAFESPKDGLKLLNLLL